MKLLILLCFFLVSCKKVSTNIKYTAKQVATVKKELPTFFIYGEPPPIGYLCDENSITEKYGFKVKRVAGCEVSQKLIDEVNLNNAKMIIIMNKKYGNNWLKNFEKKTGLKW